MKQIDNGQAGQGSGQKVCGLILVLEFQGLEKFIEFFQKVKPSVITHPDQLPEIGFLIEIALIRGGRHNGHHDLFLGDLLLKMFY